MSDDASPPAGLTGGTSSNALDARDDGLGDVNVALGVTGSIAAVRTVSLAHELRRQGASVRAITTDAATGIVHPQALTYATGAETVTDITGGVEHVALCGRDGWADVLLIAPATANTVGKIAHAVDDTPVTTCATTAIGADCPVVLAPAMHEPMYDHPGVLDALATVETWGVDLVDPQIDEGKAKLASDEAIVTAVARAATPNPLAGEHVVVTSGATRESVDPVRVLTSRASGKTGRAVARACYARGATVTLLHGGGPVPYADVVDVTTASEMTDAAIAAVEDGNVDALVSAAAVADYAPVERPSKIPSGRTDCSIDLEPTRKLVDEVRAVDPALPIVGFKTESGVDRDALVERARETRDRVDMAFVVANDASVMGSDSTNVKIVDEVVESYAGSKAGLGRRVATRLASVLASAG